MHALREVLIVAIVLQPARIVVILHRRQATVVEVHFNRNGPQLGERFWRHNEGDID